MNGIRAYADELVKGAEIKVVHFAGAEPLAGVITAVSSGKTKSQVAIKHSGGSTTVHLANRAIKPLSQFQEVAE